MSTRLPWSRLLAELVVIVAGVLLALGADAWWQERVDHRAARVELSQVRDEIRRNRPQLQRQVDWQQRITRGILTLRTMTADLSEGTTLTVPDTLVGTVIGHPTLEMSTSAMSRLLTSGRLPLLGDEELQRQLADWPRLLDDLRETEVLQRSIVMEHAIPFFIDQDIDIGRAIEVRVDFLWERMSQEQKDGETRLRISEGLGTLLGERASDAPILRDELVAFLEFEDQLLAAIDRFLDQG